MCEYLPEIEADFLVFYRIFDLYEDPRLDGPRFISLSTQLPRYDGAVRRRLEMEAADGPQALDSGVYESDTRFSAGESMSMGEALARSQGSEIGVLNSLSNDSRNAGLGDLFEYETV